MGEVCGTDDGLAAMAVIGDFIFFAGKANEKLISYKSESCQKDFVIMVPQNEEWALMIEQHYKEKAKKISRYAIKKEPDVFDIDKLTQAVQDLPEEYTLRMIEICGYRREQDELFNNI